MQLNQQTPSTENATDRVTEAELPKLLALCNQQLSNATRSNTPTVADVAEAYEIPTEEVERLLRKIRAGHRPLATPVRNRITKRVAAIALALLSATLLYNLNYPFTPNGPSNPVFSLQSVTESRIDPGPFERVDVVLQYHPSSLKHLLLGPQWNHPWNTVTVSDAHTGAHQLFTPVPGGGSQSVGFGRCYRIGLYQYHVNYDIPIVRAAADPITIHQNFPIDGQDLPLTIPLNQRR